MRITAPPAIIIRNAYLDYSGTVIFSNLNCEMPAGKWTCILGPSGVGKSTLLRIVAGLGWHDPASKYSGEVISNDGLALTDRIAYMAQTDLLMPWLTVIDNVMLGFRLRGNYSPAIKQRALELLARVGLMGKEQLKPASLSGGMRQRVAIARTLIEDKPIVVMDEPFSALDAITRLTLQDVAAELLQDKTVLLVTHDPLEAIRLGHHIYILAGKPAQLEKTIDLSGKTPRDLQQTEIMQLQATLLKSLALVKERS